MIAVMIPYAVGEPKAYSGEQNVYSSSYSCKCSARGLFSRDEEEGRPATTVNIREVKRAGIAPCSARLISAYHNGLHASGFQKEEYQDMVQAALQKCLHGRLTRLGRLCSSCKLGFSNQIIFELQGPAETSPVSECSFQSRKRLPGGLHAG